MLKDKLKALLQLRGTSISKLAEHKKVSIQHQSNKIKALIKLANKTQQNIASALNITPQSLGRKIKTNNFNVAELIQFAELVGCEIHFIDKNTKETVIKLNENDLENK